ncbi:MAG: hypothetical protein DRJ49_03905 [Thermoprotei archaeon]|nr:MAG: hypothetical protein DRJ49_03905 [Thermoprotei archaeon]
MYSTEISCVKIENLYNFILVLTTYPSKETTYRIAKSILHERLAVCTSITTDLEQLVSRLKELHPYEVPEIVAVSIAGRLEKYLS